MTVETITDGDVEDEMCFASRKLSKAFAAMLINDQNTQENQAKRIAQVSDKMRKFFMSGDDDKVSILDTNPEENVDLIIQNSIKEVPQKGPTIELIV